MLPRILCAVLLVSVGKAAAQGPSASHYDLNVYPTLTGPSGLYDMNVAAAQKGPPGTIALTTSTPAPAYSFKDVVANTHGYVSTGVSTGSGHFFEGGVSVPLVPGKAELELSGSSGQLPTFKVNGGGRTPTLTYDAYNVGLALHPSDNVSAYIGFSGLRLHANGQGGLYPFGPNAYATP